MVGFTCLWLGAVVAAAAEGTCAELDGAKPQAQMDYLQRDRSTLNAACITHAMFQIAYAPDRQIFDRKAEAIKTLVGYLDYRPPDESKLSRIVSRNRDPYPATEALSAMGKVVVPYAIEAIAGSATSDIARFNATVVIFEIYIREGLPEAIRVLERAAHAKESIDWTGSLRLHDAARKTADTCKGDIVNSCMGALFTREE